MRDDGQGTLRLLQDPTFAGLAREAVSEYLDWDQLTRRPLPVGLSAAETWSLLQALRRLDARLFPLVDVKGRDYWYTLPRESVRCLELIEHHCRSDSRLHLAVHDREGQRYLVRSRIQEAIATCQLDGVRLAYEEAGRLLHEGRTPQSPAERLVLNSHGLLADLEEYAREPFSPALLRSIYERVVDGVDTSRLERMPIRYNLTQEVHPGTLDAEQAEEVLGKICDYANGEIGDVTEAVAIKGYNFISTLGFWHPLPDFNGTVGRYALRVFAHKHDYPVLGYLPISRMTRKWVEGRVDSSVVRFTDTQRPPGGEAESVDYTPDLITHLQLVVAALEELVSHIEKTRKRDEEMQAVLEFHEDLNYRQRSVLSRALARPEAEFRIRYHQTTHRVVYATARADLLDLVEKGYLSKEQRGKAFVFVPVADLAERLGSESAA